MEFYQCLRRLPSRRIDETLNTPNFHFNGFFDKSVSNFSGGMTQCPALPSPACRMRRCWFWTN